MIATHRRADGKVDAQLLGVDPASQIASYIVRFTEGRRTVTRYTSASQRHFDNKFRRL